MLHVTADLLETADVGRVLGITPAGVRRVVASGHLVPVVVLPRGSRLFARADVERLAARRREQARRRAEVPA